MRPDDEQQSRRVRLNASSGYSCDRLHYVWRAVDQEGEALDILVLRSRDKKLLPHLLCCFSQMNLDELNRFANNLARSFVIILIVKTVNALRVIGKVEKYV